MADNSKAVEVKEPEFEFVEVPEKDIFGKSFDGVSVNLEKYGPGKHKVTPQIAVEIRRLLLVRQAADLRIFQPTQDVHAMEIMAKNYGGHQMQKYNG